ncbi:putative leucine-rich repeat receptor-like serine/threonine-protein kinase At3g14840 isoform X2 [Apium graveolens]|uniref:putative leucine-rich repeat receptor-like serine/threonine-protein kinase At3g14840 isoform X2 n=1 Tax=Apium graveolens TaxID=4045 RepID=UPI003D78C773
MPKSLLHIHHIRLTSFSFHDLQAIIYETMSKLIKIKLNNQFMVIMKPRGLAAPVLLTQQLVITVLLFYFICFAITPASAALASDEVEALKESAKTLGKTNWNFDVDPCSGASGWNTSTVGQKSPDNAVSCGNCSSNGTVCHVTGIILKSQNLTGKLPPEFQKLPYLQVIDLTRNYIEGTLPVQWASLKLVQMELDANRMSGNIPPQLGDLPAISAISLSSNNFTGPLPDTLAKLTSLTDFRISDNNFSGKIPSYIQTWTNLKRLDIQASGLDGPIPDFSLLANFFDLRISDLNGNDGKFPALNKSSFREFKTLILRSCNIVGQLPEYLGEMEYLTTLDLSFNRLSGTISSSMKNLSAVDNIYFTGNLLSGSLPDWILNSHKVIDLSYNNLTLVSPGNDNCLKQGLNLFGSSSKRSPSGTVSCLQSQSCPRYANSFYINCGGSKQTSADGTIYAEDSQSSTGPSKFYRGDNWASSSTGSFLDGEKNVFTKTDSSFNGDRRELLMDARLSPLSLTYYGFCLFNGKYTVKLYFAEIMFSDNQTFSSLGRRIFDIYIQGKLERKDFNIKDEAGGVYKEVVLEFPASVNSNTLEIRFYWAGKGTTITPTKGVYGPLISAIAVSREKKSASVGTVVGIVVGVASAIFLLLGILWWKGCLRRRDTMRSDLQSLDLQTGSFTLKQIRAATNNFDSANKIGEGGFGPVYKGLLLDGTVIAVKQLSQKSKQGNREFVTEIGMISALQHPNLVKLYGCCIEGNELLLIYEYLENNSLARALFGNSAASCFANFIFYFQQYMLYKITMYMVSRLSSYHKPDNIEGPERYRLELNWPTRYRVCIGIARGLAYLHEESRLKIVHRDIKATNVLLDKDLNPKISDFGLAKLDEEDNTHISTRIAGTFGYMAPEYAMRGYLTDKADVYSFGIVALEIVSGRSNTSNRPKQEPFYLLDWANDLKLEGKLMELVDESLGLEYKQEEALLMINVGLMCTNMTSAERPAMSSVVSILEGRADVPEFESVSEPTMKIKHHQSAQSISIDEDSWIASSASGTDLYSVALDTDYMLKNASGR